jgi:hypothetical protein
MLHGGGGGHGGGHHGGGGGGHHGGHHGGGHGGGWYGGGWGPYYGGWYPEVVVDPIYIVSDTPNSCGGWHCSMHRNMCPCTCPFRQLTVTTTPSSLTGLGAVEAAGSVGVAALVAVVGLVLVSML